ncbi:hypothetical protein BDV26DRAFT_264455 [Aspergillus bertholletiae]|uniref:Uncharacterized protein n=1 Tax=Aspergillus bertholletiae TaxID=1226010 RepID=A0A5N7B4Q5_9EURO|nr:hypothetical protein BDV26DRAFT_264455 [Aspergillus bertholletiae]
MYFFISIVLPLPPSFCLRFSEPSPRQLSYSSLAACSPIAFPNIRPVLETGLMKMNIELDAMNFRMNFRTSVPEGF